MEINGKKSVLIPTQKVDHLGFTLDFVQGKLLVPTHKNKEYKEGVRKTCNARSNVVQENGCHFGQGEKFLGRHAFLRAFTDLIVQFITQHQQFGWDSLGEVPPLGGPSEANKIFVGKSQRNKIFGARNTKKTSFGLFGFCLGRGGSPKQAGSARLLERSPVSCASPTESLPPPSSLGGVRQGRYLPSKGGGRCPSSRGCRVKKKKTQGEKGNVGPKPAPPTSGNPKR